MIYVGIDPGTKGAIGSIDDDGNLTFEEMPKDDGAINEYFLLYKDIIKHVYLEKAQVHSGNGAVGMFNYGRNYGIIIGILTARKIPYTLVTPKFWQKIMFVGTTTKKNPKERALEAANRVFAKESRFWFKSSRCKKPHDGIIDSVLIAECCRRIIK